MSIDHIARLNRIRDHLEAHLRALPAPAKNRIVTRSWKPLQNMTKDELEAGQYTLISILEKDFKNYNGGEAQDGRLHMVLIGRFKLPEKATGQDIEDAEWRMFDEEIAPWLRALPLDLCCLIVTEFKTSGQLQHPYGLVAFELEECTE